jgi:hypothetical protein
VFRFPTVRELMATTSVYRYLFPFSE